MIFVTVGTHEQPFNRLLEEIDKLIENGTIKEDVFAQIGYSTYIPKHYKYTKFLDYNVMQEYFKNANIVITHGGPSSFMEAIKLGKNPIVVPRQEAFKEHINDHQCLFCDELKKRYDLIVVRDIQDLGEEILNLSLSNNEKSFKFNNQFFVDNLIKLIKEVYDGK